MSRERFVNILGRGKAVRLGAAVVAAGLLGAAGCSSSSTTSTSSAASSSAPASASASPSVNGLSVKQLAFGDTMKHSFQPGGTGTTKPNT